MTCPCCPTWWSRLSPPYQAKRPAGSGRKSVSRWSQSRSCLKIKIGNQNILIKWFISLPSSPTANSTSASGTSFSIADFKASCSLQSRLYSFKLISQKPKKLNYPCSILTLTGGGLASGILSGRPGPLAGGPTSETSGMLRCKARKTRGDISGSSILDTSHVS